MGPNWELISDAMNSTLKIKVSACCFETSWDSFFGAFRTEWQSYTSIVFFFFYSSEWLCWILLSRLLLSRISEQLVFVTG